MNRKIPYISIIVLCYQSGDTIRSFVEQLISSLEKLDPNWEIILVANYFEQSGDKTHEIAKELTLRDKRIQSVIKVKEGMMGWDMKSGLKAATGRCLAVIDGDGQMPAEDVVRVYKKLMEENLDLVKTYRPQRDDGFYRIFISVIYNIVFKILFPGLECRDINSKPKIMKRKVYERMDLQSNGWFIDAEIMIQSRKMKLNVGEIPTMFKKLYSRPSFIKFSAIVEFAGNLLLYRLMEFWKGFNKNKFD